MNRFTILLLLVILFSTNSLPQSPHKYSDIFFLDDHNGWILSTNGYLWKTTNAGTDWIRIYDSRIDTSGKITFVDEQNGWLSLRNTLLRSSNGGLNWVQEYEFPLAFYGYDIEFANDSIGFADDSGRLYKSVDQGQNWELVTDTLGQIYDISFYKDSIGYLCFSHSSPNYITQTRYIYKTTDQGETWIRSYFEGGGLNESVYYDKICIINKTDCIISAFLESPIGGFSSLIKTTDAGSTWELLSDFGVLDLAFVSPQKGWAINGYSIVKTTDGGLLWDTLQTFATWDDVFTNFEFFNPNISYGINQNHIYRTIDGWVTYSIVDSIVTGLNEQQITATEFILEQNYPNPFNPNTVIKYQIPITSQVTLKVYDILGNEIATLVNEEKSEGNYSYSFTPSPTLSSGIYFYQLKTDNFIHTKKMLLLK
ncbi:MAG TPA: T9SS type A sorting domain-containing protein [Ignavibacteriaceae bacterium]